MLEAENSAQADDDSWLSDVAESVRPVHYREAAESLRALDYMGAADLLDSVARDLDDEQSPDYQNEPEGEPTHG